MEEGAVSGSGEFERYGRALLIKTDYQHIMKIDNKSQSTIDNAIEFAREIVDRIEKDKQNLPYRMNIIDELHANENADSVPKSVSE